MRKLILFLLLAIMIAGCTKVDPHRFEGCVIVNKLDMPYYHFDVKLTPYLRDSLKTDYYTFYTKKYEWDKYNIGDTIR